MSTTSSGTMSYRLDRAVVLRVVGPFFVLVGVAWVVLTAVGGGATPALVLAVLTLALVLGGALALYRPPTVVALSEDGYRVSLVRGAGVTAADWSDVESVDTKLAGGAPSIVVTLRGGGTTVIPLSLLGRQHVDAQRDIHNRLNTAFGYRHLGPRQP
jgi:hypothetical protein